MRQSRRPLALAVATVLVGLAALPPTVLAAPQLPDLGMARLADLRIEKTPDGRRLLRFSTTIVNVGAGAFEVRGSRSSTADPMVGYQCIYDSGTCVPESTAVTMRYSGDGHNHFHVVGLEAYELERLDDGVKLGTGAKTGFCFYDTTAYRLTLPGAPQSRVYYGCGNANSLNVTMGLSIGWGDTYPSYLPDQWVDVTGLTAGRYRLWATADPQDWFAESNNANNLTWVDLQIKGKGASVRVLGYGPSA